MLKKIAWPDQIAIAALAVAWVAFFSRTLFNQLVYFLDDLKIIYYPLESVYATMQQANQLPLWSRFFGFGQPLLAWGQLGFFNPLHLTLRSFSLHPITLLQVSILMYFALGSLGMFIFLRRLKISAVAALAGAFVFTYGGFHVGHLNHVNFYTATMLLPWLLSSLDWFSTRRHLPSFLLTALLSATIALSGQPQIVLYTFVLAAIWFAILLIRSAHRFKLFCLTSLLGLLSLTLAAPAILPLAEFLPVTERAYGLGRAEILEFSYPPSHAITLLFPYFFGDHHYYWGAKNFQELAAYTGILPLLLIGLSLFSRRRTLQLFGLTVTILGLLFALGQYSPLFLWLVDHGLIKSLSIPGRFTFFFIVGVSILSALGLDTVRHLAFRQKSLAFLLCLALVWLLFTPVINLLYHDQSLYQHWLSFLSYTRPEPYLIALGVLLFLGLCLLPNRYLRFHYAWLVSSCIAVTLIIYGWNYNPLTPSTTAYQSSPFFDELQSYYQSHHTPPRIYHVEHPSIAARRRTEPITPLFTVIQPITTSGTSLSCFTMPYQLSSDRSSGSVVDISLTASPTGDPLSSITIDPASLNGTLFNICFNPVPTKVGDRLWLRFSSQADSGFRLIYQPASFADQAAYLLRVTNPTAAELQRSIKPITIVVYAPDDLSSDLSARRLDRHINATAFASSANWIGALSVKTYRSFVASLLDDDIDPIHNDSVSVINDRRAIINLAGITHLVETAVINTDYSYITAAGFKLVSSDSIQNNVLRLHQNQLVLPKAWLVKQAVFSPVDDETVSAIRQRNDSVRELVYINGPTPPDVLSSMDPTALVSQVSVTRYDDTIIDLQVETNQSAWLVFNDTSTPAWHTYIDDQPAPYYTAFSLFKAAQVPAGQHTVSFRYESRLTNLSIHLAAVGLLIVIILFAFQATGGFNRPGAAV